ncbi:hypothetical protein MAR_001446 [Mya arenaria]|uniref:Uncharacterized protein n=1 Tax=Mya arenaria TaxID=6604 RepID=A0ABY7FBT6_MYAAR|nr:hypothetical protein MAR_001446 [Mya arenaria]
MSEDQIPFRAQGQAPYDQQQYPAQLPFQTGQITPGTSVVSNQEIPDPPSYEKCVDNYN